MVSDSATIHWICRAASPESPHSFFGLVARRAINTPLHGQTSLIKLENLIINRDLKLHSTSLIKFGLTGVNRDVKLLQASLKFAYYKL